MKVAVIGCGYVGLISAVGLASVGHAVVGVEADAGRRELIAGGRAPFHEPGLARRLRACLADGSLRVSGRLDDAVDADVVMLAVQTPPRPDGGNDLSHLRAAAADLAGTATAPRPDGQVVVVRSTVVPGTNEGLLAPILSHGQPWRAVASNPEFLREGSAMSDFLEPDRVVIGVTEEWAAQRLARLYAPLPAPLVHTTPATAELIKYASNALLATMISFSNEIARIAEGSPGVDAEDVMAALHLDRRLRPVTAEGAAASPGILAYLRAGCGFGGSCLPKDLSALITHARTLGEDPRLLEAVRAVNDSQPSRLIAMAERELGSVAGRRIALLGVAFKAGTNDLRASSGVELLRQLGARGADVVVHDPLVTAGELAAVGLGDVAWCGDLATAVRGAEAVVIATDAPEYAALPRLLRTLPSVPLVVDGRRTVAVADVAEGRYVGIGLARPAGALLPS